MSTVCSECGGQEAVEWRVDDLSKQSRIGKTRSLFRRLTEIEDVRVGYSELFEAVKKRVRDPANQGKKQRKVFGDAVDSVANRVRDPDSESTETLA